ncbi:hypothetical protein OSTOST_03829, partial [Ostertagia ostertagi]
MREFAAGRNVTLVLDNAPYHTRVLERLCSLGSDQELHEAGNHGLPRSHGIEVALDSTRASLLDELDLFVASRGESQPCARMQPREYVRRWDGAVLELPQAPTQQVGKPTDRLETVRNRAVEILGSIPRSLCEGWCWDAIKEEDSARMKEALDANNNIINSDEILSPPGIHLIGKPQKARHRRQQDGLHKTVFVSDRKTAAKMKRGIDVRDLASHMIGPWAYKTEIHESTRLQKAISGLRDLLDKDDQARDFVVLVRMLAHLVHEKKLSTKDASSRLRSAMKKLGRKTCNILVKKYTFLEKILRGEPCSISAEKEALSKQKSVKKAKKDGSIKPKISARQKPRRTFSKVSARQKPGKTSSKVSARQKPGKTSNSTETSKGILFSRIKSETSTSKKDETHAEKDKSDSGTDIERLTYDETTSTEESERERKYSERNGGAKDKDTDTDGKQRIMPGYSQLLKIAGSGFPSASSLETDPNTVD